MARTRYYTAHATTRMESLEGIELASFRRRAFAWSLDFFLASLLAGAIGAGWARLTGAPVENISFSPLDHFSDLLIGIAYFGLSTWRWQGQTLGKKLFGIRVVSLVHAQLSLWHCVERTLGYVASALEAGFGFWQYFIHPNRQTVHDRIGETIVIRAPRT